MKIKLIFIFIIFLFNFTLPSFAEENNKDSSSIGHAEYNRSCAACHGLDAKGNGVMADSLKKKPSDLTTLSQRNDGHFPHQRIYQTIEGLDQLPEHGTREMPIWGEKYKKQARLKNEDEYLYLRGRMFELMMYIQSIQE